MLLDVNNLDGVSPWLGENHDFIDTFGGLKADSVVDSGDHLLLDGNNCSEIGVVLLLEHFSGLGLGGSVDLVVDEGWELRILDRGESSRD